MSADATASTAKTKTTTKTKKTTAAAKQSQSQNMFVWIALAIAILACAGVAYLLIGAEKQKTSIQQSLQANQAQITTLQSQATQAQAAMQNNMQQALQANQQSVQKALAQLNQGKQQADKQIALSSVVYLVRMANLALLINQDPKVATHFLDLAQSRLQDMPSLESLRTDITNEKEKLVAVPNLDVDGILMQLGGLKKVIMALPNTPHWTQQADTKKEVVAKETTLKQKATADWSTLWNWLKRFVIISHRDNDPNVLPTPEHFQSVQDSVYLGLSTAQWAVLHKNTDVYQHALTAAINQLNSIKQSDTQTIAKLVKEVTTLSKATVDPHYPNLDSLMNQIVTLQNQLATNAQAATPTVTAGDAMTKSLTATSPSKKTNKTQTAKLAAATNQEVVA